MTKYRVRWWTGPTRVQHYVRLLAQLTGFHDVMDGTEHVYFTIEARDETAARFMIENAIGKSFCCVEAL